MTNGNELLELTKRILVLAEEVRKLVPNQNNFRFILFNDIQNPVFEIVSRKRKCSYTFFSGELKQVSHQFGDITALFQRIDNFVSRGLCKSRFPFRLFQQAVDKCIVRFILQPFNNTLFQSVFASIRNILLVQGFFDAFLYSQEQLFRSANITGRVTISCYNASFLMTDQLFEQSGILFQWLVSIPVSTNVCLGQFKNSSDSKRTFGFTCTICTMNPYRTVGVAAKHSFHAFQQLYESFVRICIGPICTAVDCRFIYAREIPFVYIKVVAILIWHFTCPP